MYIEMVDETGRVSQETIKRTQKSWSLRLRKLGEAQEMAVTFVTSHELNELPRPDPADGCH